MTIDDVIAKAHENGWHVRHGSLNMKDGPRKRTAMFSLDSWFVLWYDDVIEYTTPQGNKTVINNIDAQTLWTLLCDMSDLS